MFPPTTIIFILLQSLQLTSAFRVLNYSNFTCDSTTDLFTANTSSYSSDLDTLLSALSTNLSDGFANYTVGSTNPASAYNTTGSVYGLALCRGDVPSSQCNSCISEGIATIRSQCYSKKEAIVWREWCTLRYANRYIFSTVELKPHVTMLNVNEASDLTSWMKVLGDTLKNVTERAAGGDGMRKFATDKVAYTSQSNIYSLAQCTPDVTEEECKECFRVATNSMSVTRNGSIALLPSCSVRYEMYLFYFNETKTTLDKYSPDATTDLRGKRRHISKVVAASIALLVLVLVLLILMFICHLCRRRRIKKLACDGRHDLSIVFSSVTPIVFEFSMLQDATKDFSDDNSIGQGGFGTVYKGELSDGRKIAVKKLFKKGQDFNSEVVSLVKVQHRNLVKLLGYCSTIEENLLVYEFVPNYSLDHFLFGTDPTNQGLLDWPTRFEIINGISRGLLYLHEDSKPKIIHRDLKPSNILLDMNMDPKIGDFGLARIFGADQTHEMTQNVAGTKGYMAPEYVQYGKYSAQSDVYGFGVIVLEIVSGKKNTSFRDTGLAEDLISYAWEKWEQGNPMALLDSTLTDISSQSEDQVMNCIKIGLSCIQQGTEKRPPMSKIVRLLHESASNSLPILQQPYFYVTAQTNQAARAVLELDQATNQQRVQCSVNEVTITELEPR